ncbi:MAG: hypothetical protein ACP5RD_07940 [bacterium]|jgi:hypothetical protein
MEDNIFKNNVKEIVSYFTNNEFELAIFKANEIKEQLLNTDEIEFIDCLINVIKATSIINSNGDLKEAYKLLLDSYNKLRSFRPFYKGLKLENFINSIQESIAEIKNYIN